MNIINIDYEKDKKIEMIIIKSLILIILFGCFSYIGIIFAKRYKLRVDELKEMKSLLNIFSTKIKMTYETIPQIFKEIGEKNNTNISNIFKKAYINMDNYPAGDAWKIALEERKTNFKKEDIEILKGLSNLLGKVDLEGQISEIELVDNFLNSQIEKAEEECKKNRKLCKTLGIVIGLAIMIILI